MFYEYTNLCFCYFRLMKKYGIIGIMSGTSLDGLDIAYCKFEKNKKSAHAYLSSGGWKCKTIYAETKKYNKEWKKKLRDAFRMKKGKLAKLDKEYGKFIGNEILNFTRRKNISPDFISSHGHTVFHQPEKKITFQIGNGKTISSICHLPVVCDFRSGDVAIGGHGAPLVPVADKNLFSEYFFCLNLGGIANVSFDNPMNERIAFDICPVNIPLNRLANKLKKEFDRNGKMASKGKINNTLLVRLNKIPFYDTPPPKSLGREWIEKEFFPIVNSFSSSIHTKLRTVVEHIAVQISSAVNSQFAASLPHTGFHRSLLVTGGGAYNKFLMERISHYAKPAIILPDDKTIQFKEAMAFAFLGLLKMQGEINILKSVTGAKSDSSGGRFFFPG